MEELNWSIPQWLMVGGESVLLVVTIVFFVLAMRRTVRWAAFCAVLTLLVASGFTVAGAWMQAYPPAPGPVVVAAAEIDQPVRPTDAAREVSMCTVFGGTLVSVPGDQLVIGEQAVGDTRWYFESDVDVTSTPTGLRFKVQVELGDSEDRARQEYRVLPVYVPTEEVHDLISTNEDRGDTFWGGYDVPANSIRGTEVTVIRSGSKACS